MVAFIGRKVTLTQSLGSPGGSPLGPVFTGMRTKNVTFLGEAVDTTSDDTSGAQEFITEAPRTGVTIEVSGITKDSALIDTITTEGVVELTQYVLNFVDIGKTITADWVLSNVSFGVEYEDAVTFSFTMGTNGAFVVT